MGEILQIVYLRRDSYPECVKFNIPYQKDKPPDNKVGIGPGYTPLQGRYANFQWTPPPTHTKCPPSLVTREMQTKTAMRYHFILSRMAIIKEI